MKSFSTPMMQQYARIKQQYADCLLFFRLGDFYELFLDDALIGARVLGITLTKRPRGKDGDIPMAGVPYHAATTYINKLIKSGYTIAICEQISEPNAKGIVDRAVVRIITPGTVLDETSLSQKKHNYVLALAVSAKKFGLAVADVSTGHFLVTEFDRTSEDAVLLKNELIRFDPQEILVSTKSYENHQILNMLTSQDTSFIAAYPDWEARSDRNKKNIQEHYNLVSLQKTDLEARSLAIEAASNVLSYLEHTQQQHIQHLSLPTYYSVKECLLLDVSTTINLELFSTLRSAKKEGSLLGLLDQTVTAAGGRLLHSWLSQPLHDQQAISNRLDAVEELYSSQSLRMNIISELRSVYDIERQLAKLSLNMATAAAVINVQQSLKLFLQIQKLISRSEEILWDNFKKISPKKILKIINKIDANLEESTSQDNSAVYTIKSGVNSELDSLREVKATADTWLQNFEKDERKRSGISTLKCKFNSVFGFYIEVSNANLASVPDNYERKQTLVNAERFITPELKEHEQLVLSAEEKIERLETELFSKLVAEVLNFTDDIKHVAFELAQLDVISSFAQMAQSNNYCKPTLNTDKKLKIIAGRHPVVESLIEEQFVPNDVELDSNSSQLLLITGPNMAGKSVVMRQVACIVLMAHIGCFVPAESASIPLTDRIFVRSGASDNISDGLSTFMVEMVEAAYILRHATSDSLVIMDEIGRGTSTYDGISIAWAIAEYLVQSKISPKVLFATHYHELQELADDYPDKVKNYKVAVERHQGKPLFLYTLQPGKSSHSFGISVAELAGLPDSVLKRATKLLKKLEKKEIDVDLETSNSDPQMENQESSQKVIDRLQSIKINNLTPIESIQVLAELIEMSNVSDS